MKGITVEGPTEVRRIRRFIQQAVRRSGAKGVVVGLSGGVDSSVVGELCVRALGRSRVEGLLLPSRFTPAGDVRDARWLARRWKIRLRSFEITPVVKAVSRATGIKGDRLSVANVQARVRMTILYYVANSEKLLVAGTGDRSEEEVGFFTKFGDGGVDFLPIAHLYKTQVRSLGAYLGLPARIFEKPASPQLWPGHTAAEELPVGYERLDVILHSLIDEKLSEREAASRAGVKLGVVKGVVEMRLSSAHKRRTPPSLI